MTITCENCNTRFVLDEARIPPQGARVRCSRCQHRFHVKPPPAQPTPEEIVEQAVENSAPFDPLGGREPAQESPPEPEPAPREGRRDADARDAALDNPEFLFDEPGDASAAGRVPAREPAAEAPELMEREEQLAPPLTDEREEPVLDARPDPQPEAPPPPAAAAPEERAAAEEELGGSTATGLREDLFGAPPDEGLSIGTADDGPTPELAHSPRRSAAEIRGATSAAVPMAGLSLDVAPEPASSPAPWRGFAREVVSARDPEPAKSAPRRRAEPEPAARATPGRFAGFVERVAAFVVAAALVGGAARTLVLDRVHPQAAIVRGAGWIATDVDAFHVRSADGRRVLVIRGALLSEGSQPPPDVRAQVLDAQGAVVAGPVSAVPLRLDGSGLTPEAIATRLASRASAPRAGPVGGFTVLVPDPPPQARRYRLELSRPAG
jgi:predicted Zn finger-like uncharacterized protein